MWKITMEMLDAAQYYIEQTGAITFHWEKGNSAFRLACRIYDANGRVGHVVCKRIADEVLLKAVELLG